MKYLQVHNYEIYNEVMLNLFTFNRFNFHENLIFHWGKRLNGNSKDVTVGKDKDKEDERQ